MSRGTPRTRREPITPVEYTPPSSYALDVEVVSAAELRRRVAAVPDRGVERVDFQVVLHVTRGTYRHMVDFDVHRCGPGSVLVLSPGQAHRFGEPSSWDGWMLIFRAETLAPGDGPGSFAIARHVADLPTHLHLERDAREAVAETIRRMTCDARLRAPRRIVASLLASQLETVLLRLAHAASDAAEGVDPTALGRFARYRAAVEREHTRWHRVARYAKHLGCSQRSLARATMEVAGMTPKAMLTARIVLEAKRRLAHTLSPVAAIGDGLGFAEPTNFVKFFRRETGMTPGSFRAQVAAGATAPPRRARAPGR